MDSEKIRLVYQRLRQANPDPRCELNFRTPFELLVSTVLAAQTTDARVNIATEPLYRIAPTPEKLAALGVEGVTPYIKSIGLYRNKAKYIIALAERLRDGFGGEVPRDRDVLVTLPGVGRKTANVVLNVAFGEPTMPVDTHVFRVANRTGIAPGKDVLQVEQRLLEVTPAEFAQNAHHWLLLHGRYICLAKGRPHCWECPIRDLCEWPDKAARDPAA